MEYLYYRCGDEWVRVPADTFTQETGEGEPGLCPGTYYYVKATAQAEYYRGSVVFETYEAYYESRAVAGQTGTPLGPLNGLNTPFTSVGGNYFYGPPLAGKDASRNGLYVFFAIGNNKDNQRDWRRANNRVVSAVITSIESVDGPDDCGEGGACITKFYRGETLVLTLEECPEVTNGREDCSDCCRQRLPIARAITV